MQPMSERKGTGCAKLGISAGLFESLGSLAFSVNAPHAGRFIVGKNPKYGLKALKRIRRVSTGGVVTDLAPSLIAAAPFLFFWGPLRYSPDIQTTGERTNADVEAIDPGSQHPG
jgi:hypothetical protein